MTRLRRIALALAFAALSFTTGSAGWLGAAPAWAEDPAAALTGAQEEAVRALVRDYLLDNPEVLIEALHAYDRQRKEAAEAAQREALIAHFTALTEDPVSPVIGNSEGDVVVVEFFDYRCPYCKQVARDLLETVQSDGNIRLVMKEFPILGPDSLTAARAALAAGEQGRYEDFHFALMDTKGDITEQTVFSVAESLGLDLDKLKADMESEAIEQHLNETYQLAEALDINGTPAFVIGERVFPGALSMEALREAVATARAESG